MNRLSRIVEAFGQAKSSWERAFIKNIPFDIEDNVLKQPYSKSDLVYICISTTAKAISQVPLNIHERKGDELIQLPMDDPLSMLFERPNPYMDKYSFLESCISYIMLDGDVFIIPLPSFEQPVTFYVVSKKYIEPIRDRKTGQLTGWRYATGGVGMNTTGGIMLDPDDLAHAWLWNPDDPIMGFSPLEAGKIAISTDYMASKYNTNFFQNSANPGGVVYTDKKLQAPTVESIRQQIEERHKGYQKGYKLMVLDQGLKYSQTALSHKDMEFYDLRRFSAERILQLFGMKKSVISITEDLNYATARLQRKEWWQGTNLPLMHLLLSAVNFSFFRGTPYVAMFDTSSVEALHEEFSDKVETAVKLTSMGFTANEVNERLQLGFDEKDWRDIWWGPANMFPLSEETPTQPAIPTQDYIGMEDNIQIEQVKESEDNEQYKNYWIAFIRRTSPIEKRFEKKVQSIFYKMRKKSLRILTDEDKGIKSPQDFQNIEFLEEMNNLETASRSMYQASIEEGIAAVVAEIGAEIAFDLSDPVALHYLETKISKVKGVGTTIKKQLNVQLAEGMAAGESIEELARRVRHVFNAASRRAKTIARTEVVGSSNFGRHEAINRSNFKMKQWFTAMDERVRPAHGKMHGSQIRVGEYWQTELGSLRYPGDYLGSAANIINCRCIEVIVPGS